jgi:hypothetical protein
MCVYSLVFYELDCKHLAISSHPIINHFIVIGTFHAPQPFAIIFASSMRLDEWCEWRYC